MATIRTPLGAPGRAGLGTRSAAAGRSPATAGRAPRRKTDAQAASGRVYLVGALVGILYAALAARLAYIQVYRHDAYVEEARAIRDKSVPVPAQRGVLYDRNGELLVRNEPAYDITVDPNMWFDQSNPKIGDTPPARQERALSTLDQLLPGQGVRAAFAREGLRLAKGPDGKQRYRTITVAHLVDAATGDKIKGMNLLGVGTPGTYKRTAVDGTLASHVLGFTGRDGNGLAGLEVGLNDQLAGAPGRFAAEFDTRGRVIPGTIQTRRALQPGADIVLTLDSDLQHTVQQALSDAVATHHAIAGTAVVIDPHTGDILALANCPTFDVNNANAATPDARVDRAVGAPYEPGSTLKPVTIASALEEKVVTMDSRFFCKGEAEIAGHTIHCALEHPFENGHGDESLLMVVQNSCNIATAEIAMKLGKQTLYRYERMFGFGAKTGSGLPGESRGLLRSGDKWSQIQLANVAFGQGISVTPLQLAAAYATIANDGVYVRPRIVLGTRDPETEQIKPDAVEQGRRVISPQTAAEVRVMLAAVVANGTGRPAQLNGYTAGGKTGTAQIAEAGHYSGKFVASFVGMAPMAAPKYVILVAITAPQGDHYGGSVAGPVFKQIMERALLNARVRPDRPVDPTVKKHGGDGADDKKAGVAEA